MSVCHAFLLSWYQKLTSNGMQLYTVQVSCPRNVYQNTDHVVTLVQASGTINVSMCHTCKAPLFQIGSGLDLAGMFFK